MKVLGEEIADVEDERERQVLDMRLVPAAVGCWMATIVAIGAGWVAGAVLSVAAVVVAIGLWVVLLWAIAHRRERWRVVAVAGLAAVLLSAGFGAAGAWREYRVQAHPLRDMVGRSVSVVAVVTDDAKPMRGGGFGGQRRWIVHAELREFGGGSGWTRAGGAVVVLAGGGEWATLSPGQRVRFRAEVSRPNRADLTIAALNASAPPERLGEPPWWQRVAAGVRADLVAAAGRALPPDAAGLLPALVVGDTVALPDHVRDAFEIAGLQHLCVVSGANFTILLTALLALTRLLTAGPRISAVAAAGVVGVFVVIARPDPSVLRAAAMGSVTVLALLTGRRKQALPALCGAVIGLLAVAPQLAMSAGFALSVLATAGLILLAPSWADWLRARGWWRAPAEVMAVAAAAFVVTLPLMVALSGRVSLVAIFANALVAPVVGLITVIGAVGTAVACVWGDAAVWVLWCARPPMWWLLGVADRAAAVPGATMTVRSGTVGGVVAALIVVAVIAALRWPRTRRLLAVVAFGISIVLVPLRLWTPGWPPSGWTLAMCDVGQGDGLALSVGPGAAVVIDTGPDPRLIRRCLDALHITRIPLLILTHPHADHIDGLSGALRGRTVDAIATAPGELPTTSPDGARSHSTTPPCDAAATAASTGTALTDRESSVADGWADRDHRKDHVGDHGEEGGIRRVAESACAAGVPMMELFAGEIFAFGEVDLAVLASGAGASTSTAADEANDRSLVVMARTAVGSVLFTGDIEGAAQARVMREHDVRADVLKVPHHGSRTTTAEFFRAVRPRLALISSGRDNTFGHPHPTVTATLAALGSTIARTDRDGDVIVLGSSPADLRIITSRRRSARSRAGPGAVRPPPEGRPTGRGMLRHGARRLSGVVRRIGS
ncbi:ComEC/Rec2 family competence protein [Nocardia sp. SSK8]|uniref:ComEC/Rec2 family competence protein n=1 Tax=Nocardia sp. SSK8 TaxID=3120154 RepID=UPI00300910EC